MEEELARVRELLKGIRACTGHSAMGNVCPELVKTCDLFWCSLKAYINGLNKLYRVREKELHIAFELLDIHVLRDPKVLGNPSVQKLLQRAMVAVSSRDSGLDETERAVNGILMPGPGSEFEKTPFFVELQTYLGLCLRLDDMRQFVVQQYISLCSLVNEFETITGVTCATMFAPCLKREPFYKSPMLTKLLTAMECLAGYFTCSHCMDTKGGAAPHTHRTGKVPFLGSVPNFTCSLCSNVLKHPVVLGCGHRFCICCISNVTSDGGATCPACGIPTKTGGRRFAIDSVLQRFIQQHVPGSASSLTSSPDCYVHKTGSACPFAEPTKGKRKRSSTFSSAASSSEKKARPDFSDASSKDLEWAQSCILCENPSLKSNESGRTDTDKAPKNAVKDGEAKRPAFIRVIQRLTTFHVQCLLDVCTHLSSDDGDTQTSQQIHGQCAHALGQPHTHGQPHTRRLPLGSPDSKDKSKAARSGSSPTASGVLTNFDCLASPSCTASHAPHLRDEEFLRWAEQFNLNESTEDSTQLFADFPAKSLPIPKPSSVANLPSPAETVPKTESPMLNRGRSGRGQAAHTTPDGTIIAQGSCHQCKIKLPASRLVFCTMPRGATMHCQKKYCHGCLQRKYGISESRIPDLSQWKCPACQGFCTCAQCMRKAMKGLPTSAPTASCHQCKLKKPHEALRVCNTHSDKGRRCKKKFCQSCLAKYGDTVIACDGSDGHWACPACRGVCNCARCRRSRGD